MESEIWCSRSCILPHMIWEIWNTWGLGFQNHWQNFKNILTNKLKRIAIEHTIIAASRRPLHSPLLFGLGIQLDNTFVSKWLKDHLSQLGFSQTYFEVWNYKKVIIDTEDIILIIPPGSFTQWIADNVDHNSQTIDGKHTFMV